MKNSNDKMLNELRDLEISKNKMLIRDVWVISITSFMFYVMIILISATLLEEGILLNERVFGSTTILIGVVFYVFFLEVSTGYYECKHCHHKYVPTYFAAFLAFHVGFTRYLKCPECGKKSWSKKIMTNK